MKFTVVVVGRTTDEQFIRFKLCPFFPDEKSRVFREKEREMIMQLGGKTEGDTRRPLYLCIRKLVGKMEKYKRKRHYNPSKEQHHQETALKERANRKRKGYMSLRDTEKRLIGFPSPKM